MKVYTLLLCQDYLQNLLQGLIHEQDLDCLSQKISLKLIVVGFGLKTILMEKELLLPSHCPYLYLIKN